jgi:hypothetical protein
LFEAHRGGAQLVGVVAAGLKAGRIGHPQRLQRGGDAPVRDGVYLQDLDGPLVGVALELVGGVEALADGDGHR